MATSVKITALSNIGNAIAPTTLIPVVDMTGTPTTEKANVQILGNLILAGAGGANFVPAALANLSYSVVNAAQPNITSVGTLTGLTINGVSNLGGNANVKITGGTVGQVLSTDGFGNLNWANGPGVVWTTAPGSNTATGTAGQAAYDSGGNLYICVAANTWAKFTGTTSW